MVTELYMEDLNRIIHLLEIVRTEEDWSVGVSELKVLSTQAGYADLVIGSIKADEQGEWFFLPNESSNL